MKHLLIPLLTSLILFACKDSAKHKADPTQNIGTPTLGDTIQARTVYKTDNLVIIQLTNHVYQHISYLNSETFGNVPCNGMLVVNENKGVVFDTPTDNKSSEELISFIANNLKSKVIALIPTHFHLDCVGGIQKFEAADIPTFASYKTIGLLSKNNHQFSKPVTEFDDSLTLKIGNKTVEVRFFGEGHTRDNVIGYFQDERVIFGGCLVKEVGAGKGNLEDANVSVWPATIQKIKNEYQDVKLVIPGHGAYGGIELLDYTERLFEEK